MRARLRYFHPAVILDADVSTTDVAIYRLNSIYDPVFAVGGGQPRGHDEYALIYQHYQVMNSTWKVTFNTNTTSQHNIVGWAIRRTSTVNTSKDYIESGDSKYKVMGTDGASNGTAVLSGKVDIGKWLGLESSNERLENSFGGNPQEELFLHVFTSGANAGTNPAAINFQIEMNFDTKMREKKILISS